MFTRAGIQTLILTLGLVVGSGLGSMTSPQTVLGSASCLFCDCSWSPGVYCCMCIVDVANIPPGNPPPYYPALTCEPNEGGGGTFHCGETCPIDDEPCWEP
jgi:hypothetical protein